jgi:predicted small secreted protein
LGGSSPIWLNQNFKRKAGIFIILANCSFYLEPAMKRFALLIALASVCATSFAADGCIVAGRMNDGGWAPLNRGLVLLDDAGNALPKNADAQRIKQVRIQSPALLAACGLNALSDADSAGLGKTPKSAVPAISAGSQALAVLAVNKLPLKAGGQLVELQVRADAARVVAVSR